MSEPKRQVTVLLADDHLVVRMGIATIISFEPDLRVVAEADAGDDAMRLTAEHNPDVIVMDLLMPRMNGADAAREILRVNPAAKILILTTFGTAPEIRQALDAGVKGAILKTSTQAEIIAAIRKVAAGMRVLSPEIESGLTSKPVPSLLSERQTEVLVLVAKGYTNREIGELLHIGENGVKDHLKTIYARLGVSSRTEATSYAISERLIRV